jgi:hypothetical protein
MSTTSIILFAIFMIAMIFFGRIRKSMGTQKVPPGSTASNTQTGGYKVLQNLLGLASFGVFVGYFFLHQSFLLWIGIGLVVVVDLLNVATKIQNAAQKSSRQSPAVNEQPSILSIPQGTRPVNPPNTTPQELSYTSLSQDNSVDHFNDNPRIIMWLGLLFGIVLVLGIALAVLYFTGTLQQILPMIFS